MSVKDAINKLLNMMTEIYVCNNYDTVIQYQKFS